MTQTYRAEQLTKPSGRTAHRKRVVSYSPADHVSPAPCIGEGRYDGGSNAEDPSRRFLHGKSTPGAAYVSPWCDVRTRASYVY